MKLLTSFNVYSSVLNYRANWDLEHKANIVKITMYSWEDTNRTFTFLVDPSIHGEFKKYMKNVQTPPPIRMEDAGLYNKEWRLVNLTYNITESLLAQTISMNVYPDTLLHREVQRIVLEHGHHAPPLIKWKEELCDWYSRMQSPKEIRESFNALPPSSSNEIQPWRCDS